MRKNLAKRLLVAAVLTTCLVQPTVFASGHIDVAVDQHITEEIKGVSDNIYQGANGGVINNAGIVDMVTGTFGNNVLQPGDSGQMKGASIYNSGTMTIGEAHFINNHMDSTNPTNSFGGAIHNSGVLTIGSNSSFDGNTAGRGGALYNETTGDPLVIMDNVSFTNNSATKAYGGAIHARSGFTIGDNVKFIGNKSIWGGGAIYSALIGSPTTTPDAASQNIVIGENAYFEGNIADWTKTSWATGGAIVNSTGTMSFGNGAQFVSNKGANAGAIANADKITFNGTSLFKANEAKAGNGGAIDNSGEMVFKDNSYYSNNSATGMGGAVHNTGTLTYEKGAIFGQLVTDTEGNITGVKDGNTAGDLGGAICNEGGTVTIGDNSLFAGNSAGRQGGAIANVNKNDPSSKAKMTIGDGAYFVSNTSGAEGGAISNVNAFGVGTVEMTIGDGALFLNNKSGGQGGAIHNQRASLKIGDYAIFRGNTAVGYGGGAIYSETDGIPSSVVIGNVAAFINNKTETSHGGAIMNFNGGNGAAFTIGSDAYFEGNSAAKNGGAIANYGGIMTIADGSRFIGNTSGGNGGAIYQDNYSKADSSITINGGSSDTADTTFSGNTAAGKGGAIYAGGNVILDAANGNILFDKNTAGGVANDIYVAEGGSVDITGTKTVTSNSGIAGDKLGSISNEANLVLNGDNSQFLGSYSQTGGTTTLNGNKFFGGTSDITGGSLTITGDSEIVKGSTVAIGFGSSMNIAEKSNTIMNGIITGVGSIINEGNFTIGGDGSGFTGDYTQKSGTTTIKADGVFFGGTNKIEKGVLGLEQGASLTEDITVTDYSVAFNLHGRKVIIGDKGIEIVGKDGETHFINGSLNLEDVTIEVDPAKGITSDMYLGSESKLTNGDGSASTVIDIGKNGENVTLSLGGGFSNSGQTLNVGDGSTISLTPKEIAETDSDRTILVMDAAITGGADANIIVDGTDLNTGEGKYDVGTVIINSVNDEFKGSYKQSDGTVIVNKDAVFFNGDNVVDGGTLILNDGAKLSSSVKIDGSAYNGEATESPTLAVTGSLGEITQEMITNGNFNYANIAGSADDNIQIDQGGLILSNKSIIKNENLADGTLSLSNDKGVRYLGFANGSGVDGNVSLGEDTALSYGDGAFVKAGSTLTMDNAELLFINDKSKINYGVEIKGTGSINQSGSGMTNISSGLSDAVVNVVADGGMLNFVNKNNTKLDKVDITDDATVNVISGTSTIGDVNVTGEKAAMNIYGNSTIGDTVVDKATLGIFGNSNMGDLSLGSTLAMSANRTINNLNVKNFTLTDNSNITFDANVRNNTTDTINVITGGAFNSDNNQLLITGINLVESPIDRNFVIDTKNLVQVGGSSAGADIALKDGSLLLNTEMGRYLLSSGASGLLNGTLTQLNPQMYRGQVATVASYANQLVVNNILFDHMNILANDLMARDKNANRFAAANPLFAPYQYSKKDGNLWYKAYGNFERISMTQNLNVGNNAYGSLIGADFPLIDLKNGWKLVPTAYIGYNGGHQTFDGVSMYQNGAQLGAMGTAYKGDFITSLLAYGGGYANDMTVKGGFGGGSDTTGNWFAGVASKTAYNFHLPHDLILQPTALLSYNAFGGQNYHSNFGNMSMTSGMLNGVNVAPGVNLIWNKKSFSLYATAQLVFNIMGGVSGQAGNVDLNDVRMRTTYFEYGVGAMKRFKDRFTGYIQITMRNGARTGIGFQGGLQWKVGK